MLVSRNASPQKGLELEILGILEEDGDRTVAELVEGEYDVGSLGRAAMRKKIVAALESLLKQNKVSCLGSETWSWNDDYDCQKRQQRVGKQKRAEKGNSILYLKGLVVLHDRAKTMSVLRDYYNRGWGVEEKGLAKDFTTNLNKAQFYPLTKRGLKEAEKDAKKYEGRVVKVAFSYTVDPDDNFMRDAEI